MPKDFKDLRENASANSIKEAVLELTPLMSKRLARLLDTKAKKRAERNEKLLQYAKDNKETFVLTYNLVVQMREQRVEKVIKTFKLLALWALKFKGVRSIDDAIGIVEDVVKE